MIVRIEDLKDMSTKILNAVDNSILSEVTETLELKTEQNFLCMGVTNKKYFASVKFDMREYEEFHATVNAVKFLKLVSQFTTDTVEFTVGQGNLTIKGNGTYKLPLIYHGDNLLDLPKIDMGEVTQEFDISGSTLNSIVNYNGKELAKNKKTVASVADPRNYYYIDEHGAITFSTGACVNDFELSSTVKLLLDEKIVKLFKLFKDSSNVHFTLGHALTSDGVMQTRVRFEDEGTVITSVLPKENENLVNSVPVAAIRGRVTKDYPYSVTISRDALISTIKRLSVVSEARNWGIFDFNAESVLVSNYSKTSGEELYYDNDTSNVDGTYTATLDLTELELTVSGCTDEHITISFGDHAAFVISKENIYNVIPEINKKN